MADEKNNPSANADTGEKKTVPAGDTSGQTANVEAPKFKYKTQEEAEKAYAELESKFGEHSKEVEEARNLKEQTDTLLRAI